MPTSTENPGSSELPPASRSARKYGSAASGSNRGGGAQPGEAGAVPGRAVQGRERAVPAQVQMPVVLAELEPVPFEQHGQVGRLLELDEQDPGADRMWRTGRNEDGVAGTDGDLVHRAEHRGGVLGPHPFAQLVELQRPREPHVDRGLGLGLHDDPRLGLPVAQTELLARERAAGMEVHGQALAGVQQLDEKGRIGAEALDVPGAEPALGVGGDRVADERPVLQAAEAARVGRRTSC